MITYTEMNRNAIFDKIPHLSLLLGYAFILVIMVFFGILQYSSSNNVTQINSELRDLSILIIENPDAKDFEKTLEHFHSFIDNPIFYNLQSTFPSSEEFQYRLEPTTYPELIKALKNISIILDHYESDLIRSQTILLLAFIGLSLLLSTLLTVSEFDQMKKLEQEKGLRINDMKLMDVLERERNNIANELHDDVAQKLSVISHHFESDKGVEHSKLLKRYNKDVIQSIRTMAQTLRSPDLKNLSFQTQLEFLFSDFRSISDISLNAELYGLSTLSLSEEKTLHIYRIIQELFTNCRKHSSATFLNIRIISIYPYLKISYQDDGVGITFNSESQGQGMRSIQYRINILEASMRFINKNGLSIDIQIPVEL